MSQDNTVADRLLADARRKTARQQRAGLGKVALVVGIVALVVSPISIAGWVVGLAAIGVGIAAVRNPETAKLAKIGMGLGFLAVLVGVFFFTMNIA
jgi:ferric-dicitrate binding protein FerR (iron transport regulator)